MNFGFGKKEAPVQTGPDPLALAKIEMEMYGDLYNRMTDLCFKKCLSGLKEPDLNVGEMSCIDRCVSKYMEVNAKVGTKFQQMEQNMKQPGQ